MGHHRHPDWRSWGPDSEESGGFHPQAASATLPHWHKQTLRTLACPQTPWSLHLLNPLIRETLHGLLCTTEKANSEGEVWPRVGAFWLQMARGCKSTQASPSSEGQWAERDEGLWPGIVIKLPAARDPAQHFDAIGMRGVPSGCCSGRGCGVLLLPPRRWVSLCAVPSLVTFLEHRRTRPVTQDIGGEVGCPVLPSILHLCPGPLDDPGNRSRRTQTPETLPVTY